MSTANSSIPATSDRKRSFHRVFVNINGVTKSVLVPTYVQAAHHLAPSVSGHASLQNTFPSTTPSGAGIPLYADSTSTGVRLTPETASFELSSATRNCVLTSTKSRPESSCTVPLILRVNKQKQTPVVIRAERAVPVKSNTCTASVAAGPTSLWPRVVHTDRQTPRLSVVTKSAGTGSCVVIRQPANGSLPFAPVLERIHQNRPILIVRRSGAPTIRLTGCRVPFTSSTSSFRATNSGPVIIRPVINSIRATTTQTPAVSRPLISVRPLVEVRPSIISNARSLTKEEAAAVGWTDNAVTISKTSRAETWSEDAVCHTIAMTTSFNCEMLPTVSESSLSNVEKQTSCAVDGIGHISSILGECITNDLDDSVDTCISNICAERMMEMKNFDSNDRGFADACNVSAFNSEPQVKIIEICPEYDEDYNGSNDGKSDGGDDKSAIQRLLHLMEDNVHVMKKHSESLDGSPMRLCDDIFSSDETVSACESEHVLISPAETNPPAAELFTTKAVSPLVHKKPTKAKRCSSYAQRISSSKNEETVTPSMRRSNLRGNPQFTNVDRRCVSGIVSKAGPGRVQKARRTGGKPISAAARLGITDCVVSMGRVNLPPGKVSIKHDDVLMYACCMMTIFMNSVRWPTVPLVSEPRLMSVAKTRKMASGSSNKSSKTRAYANDNRLLLVSDVANARRLALDSKKPFVGAVPITFSCVSSTQLPAAGSSAFRCVTTPSTGNASLRMETDGMPLQIHGKDGKPAGVVVARPVNDKTEAKDKYFLIRTKAGSYLVPTDDGGSGKTADIVTKLLRFHREKGIGGFSEPRSDSSAAAISTGTLRRITPEVGSQQVPSSSTCVPVIHQQFPSIAHMSIKQEPSTCETSKSSCLFATSSLTSNELTLNTTLTPPTIADALTDAVHIDMPLSGDSNVPTSTDIEPNVGRPVTFASRKMKGKRRKRCKSSAPKKLAIDKLVDSILPTAVRDFNTYPVVDDRPINAGRERIEMLKERLRQQEEQLNEIRRLKALRQHQQAASDGFND